MKHVTFVIAFVISLNFAFGQITFEEMYDQSGTYTSLANSGDKFYIMHVAAEQCRIYNIDHTPWKTIPLVVPNGQWLYDIRFVSENLFTTDNSLCLAYIYYLYDEPGQYYTFTAKVVKEDGTVLLTIPGCQYIYVHTLSDGSTKMTAYSYDYSITPYTVQTYVYHLPGQQTSFDVEENAVKYNALNAFPNPAFSFTTIPYELPENEQTGNILLLNGEGKTIRTIPVDHHAREVKIETTQYPRGIYFYHLQAGNWQSQARKLIIN
ncbi:MAG: T9SS type A sorting domain-containing protein [Bacteroidales bacterium]|nr:T9SS type A sorting domain-containing protein [Bacteroidales bacterium]